MVGISAAHYCRMDNGLLISTAEPVDVTTIRTRTVPQTPPAAAPNGCDLLCCALMVVFSFFSFFLTIKMKSVIFRFVVGGEPVLGWCCLFFLVCHILFVVARQRSYYNTVCTVCTLCNVCNVCNVLYHRCRRNTKKKEAATSSPSSSGTFFILVWDFPSSVTVVSLVHRLYAW